MHLLNSVSKISLGQVLFLVGICSAVAGCGGAASDAPETVVAKGMATIDGSPLTGARLFFSPEASQGMGAAAATDEGGGFEVTTNGQPGAVPGRYRVTVQYYTKPDGSPFNLTQADADAGMDLDQFIAMGQVKLAVPRKYTDPQQTDLVVEVPEAGAEKLELKVVTK